MAKQTIYENKLVEEFLETIEVPGLTALTLDQDNRNKYLLRTPDKLPARIQRAYAPIGIGGLYDFSKTRFTNIPPANPEHEQMLRDFIAQAVLVRSKKCQNPTPNTFYLFNPIMTFAIDETISEFGFATQFFKIEDPEENKPL